MPGAIRGARHFCEGFVFVENTLSGELQMGSCQKEFRHTLYQAPVAAIQANLRPKTEKQNALIYKSVSSSAHPYGKHRCIASGLCYRHERYSSGYR